jgi:hypothetical protein
MQTKKKELNLTFIRSRNNNKHTIELTSTQPKNKTTSYFVTPSLLCTLVQKEKPPLFNPRIKPGLYNTYLYKPV